MSGRAASPASVGVLALAGAFAGVLGGAFAGCKYESVRNAPYEAPAPERTFQRLTKRDPESGVVLREWTAFLAPGAPSVLHGEEIVRYPSGATMWERSYDLGEPAGTWTSWYEDGAPRSRAVFAGPDDPRTMEFWHANGRLSSRGPARDGVRDGEWTAWHTNGVVAARGHYARSLREGTWTFWDERGELVEEAEFAANRRVAPAAGSQAPAGQPGAGEPALEGAGLSGNEPEEPAPRPAGTPPQ